VPITTFVTTFATADAVVTLATFTTANAVVASCFSMTTGGGFEHVCVERRDSDDTMTAKRHATVNVVCALFTKPLLALGARDGNIFNIALGARDGNIFNIALGARDGNIFNIALGTTTAAGVVSTVVGSTIASSASQHRLIRRRRGRCFGVLESGTLTLVHNESRGRH